MTAQQRKRMDELQNAFFQHLVDEFNNNRAAQRSPLNRPPPTREQIRAARSPNDTSYGPDSISTEPVRGGSTFHFYSSCDSLEDNDGFPDYYYDVRGQRTSSPVYRYNTRPANVPWQDPDTGLDLSPIAQEQSRFNYEGSDLSFGSFRPEYFDPISEDSSSDYSRWLTSLTPSTTGYDDNPNSFDDHDDGELNDAARFDDDVFE